MIPFRGNPGISGQGIPDSSTPGFTNQHIFFQFSDTSLCPNIPKSKYVSISLCFKTSLLRMLQAHTLAVTNLQIGKIPPFSKIAVTFKPIKRFWIQILFQIQNLLIIFDIVSFMTGSTIFNRLGVTVPYRYFPQRMNYLINE